MIWTRCLAIVSVRFGFLNVLYIYIAMSRNHETAKKRQFPGRYYRH